MNKFLIWYAHRSTVSKAAIVATGGVVSVVGGIASAPLIGAAISFAGFGILGGWLTGAAASSAGLAALGGGAVLAGGLGVAGGTAIVAGSAGLVGTAGSMVALAVAEKSNQKRKDFLAEVGEREMEINEGVFEETLID